MPNSRPNLRSYVTNPDNFALDFFVMHGIMLVLVVKRMTIFL